MEHGRPRPSRAAANLEARLYCRVPSSPSRLAYIDWLRGFACLLMFQTHGYDAWLGGSARESRFFMWSQLGGTFPAPMFLFLAGVSVALVADKLMRKDFSPRQVAAKIIVRGTQVLGLALLFRLQEYLIVWGWAPWTDLFRMDILNTIGVASILMGALCWAVLAVTEPFSGGRFTPTPSLPGAQVSTGVDAHRYRILAAAALTVAVLVSALTPLLWTSWRPRFLPWEVETYVNGVHNLGAPQSHLFPIFPWVGFAFAGLAVGFILISDFARARGGWIFLATGVAGVALIYASKLADTIRWQPYPVFDYWRTSPSFFVLRVGMLLVLLLGGYAWCRWGLGQVGFNPLIQLGKTSLLVYWVHIELVYGRLHIISAHSRTIAGASSGLLLIFLLMLGLSLARTSWEGRKVASGLQPAR